MTRAAGLFAAGIGLGAGLMYFLDPDRGSRRRTHARNQMTHASHRMRDAARTHGRDLSQRMNGAVDRIREARDSRGGEDDRVLGERARAKLGQVLSEAHALALDVSRGVITVSGPIVREEVRLAIKALKRVPGVRRVINALEVQESPQRIAWPSYRGRDARRIAVALAGAAGLGLAAHAAISARTQEFELRS